MVLAFVLFLPSVGRGMSLLRAVDETTGFAPVFLALVLAWVGTLIGLLGLRTQQAVSYRRLATTGLLVAYIGIACFLILTVIRTGGLLVTFVSLPVMWLGFALTGGVYARARVLSRWGSIVLITLIIGSGLQIILYMLGGTLVLPVTVMVLMTMAVAFALGCIWFALGYMLWLRWRGAAPSR